MVRTPNVWHPTSPGIWNVNSYLSSGIPFVTGSVMASGSFAVNNGEIKIEFPYVTRSITIISRQEGDIRVHFNSVTQSSNVIDNHHYLTLTQDKDSVTLDVKCKEIYFSLANDTFDAEFEMFAELTNILPIEMFGLEGDGLTS